MILVTAEITAKPGSEAALADLVTSVLAPTRAEAGCAAYTCGRSVEDPSVFYFTELWEDMDALRAHTRTEHMGAFGAAVVSLADATVIDSHVIESTRRLAPRPEG